MTTYYISPTGAGRADGSDWANAARISQLPTLIGEAGPGGTVLLRADQGAYTVTSPIQIRDGGAVNAAVTVKGVDVNGSPMAAEIVGNRNVATGVDGSEVFRLMNGADHISFENMTFRNVGNGAFRIAADIQDLTIQHIDAYNVGRLIENYASGANTSASVTGLTVRDVEVHGFSKGAIRLQYNSNTILLEDIYGDSERQSHDNFAMGVLLDGTVHDVVIRRASMGNAFNNTSAYWNGDGFTTEGGVYNVRFESTYAFGNTDAGYDLKSQNTVLVDADAADNKRNYRIWSDSVTIQNSTGDDPHKMGGTGSEAQVWLADGATATIINSSFLNTDNGVTVFALSTGATLILQGTIYYDGAGAVYSSLQSGAAILTTPPISPETIWASADVYSLPAQVQNVVLLGSAVAVFGNGSNNRLEGNALSNLIDGGEGVDYMIGGGGNDYYYANVAGDTVYEAAGQGVDAVITGVSYTLSSNVEQLWLSLSNDNVNGTGNASDNGLAGNAGNNVLTGLSGNDWLLGFGGNDALYGGDGSDWLDGGSGADMMVGGGGGYDLYIVDNAGDRVFGSTSGTDAVVSRVSYELSADADQLWFTQNNDNINGTGNSGDNGLCGNDGVNILSGGGGKDWLLGRGGNDTLLGGAGDDYIDGGAGSDSLQGGPGDDVYIVDNPGDVVTEIPGEGTDNVASLVSYTLGANVEGLYFSQNQLDLSGTGNGLDNTLSGNNGINVLSGLGGADILLGLGGNDTLVGGAGNDTLTGGAGNDTFVFAAGFGSDIIADFVPDGSDDRIDLTAFAGTGVTHVLSQNGSNAVLTFSDGSILTLPGVDAAHLHHSGDYYM